MQYIRMLVTKTYETSFPTTTLHNSDFEEKRYAKNISTFGYH